MSAIFLSYRRGDQPGYVARLADDLAGVFGDIVFRDVDSLLAGENWKVALQKQVAQAKILIAVVGRKWQSILVEREPATDYVRLELDLARMLEIPVLPIRLQESPLDFQLGLRDLDWLCDLQWFELSDRQGRWASDMNRLVDNIVDLTGLSPVLSSRNHAGATNGSVKSHQVSSGNQSPNIQVDNGDVSIVFGVDKNDS